MIEAHSKILLPMSSHLALVVDRGVEVVIRPGMMNLSSFQILRKQKKGS